MKKGEKMLKKLVAIIFALILTFTLLPVSAFAEHDCDEIDVDMGNFSIGCAKIDGIYYYFYEIGVEYHHLVGEHYAQPKKGADFDPDALPETIEWNGRVYPVLYFEKDTESVCGFTLGRTFNTRWFAWRWVIAESPNLKTLIISKTKHDNACYRIDNCKNLNKIIFMGTQEEFEQKQVQIKIFKDGIPQENNIEIEFFEKMEKGDVTRDGALNNKDITEMFRVLSGDSNLWLDEAVCDMDGDSIVNNKDLALIFRKVSEN